MGNAQENAREGAWDKLGQLMAVQQGLMTSLGVNQPRLQSMIDELNALPTILGAKISGSGLGDCVVGLGNVSVDNHFTTSMEPIPVVMSIQGVHCEKI